MNKFFKILFFALFIRPLIYIVIGLNVRNLKNLPKDGPLILVANHSSHIDTMILMSLFPIKTVLKMHPIAAKDYFLKTKLSRWFYTKIIEIIPIEREQEKFTHIHPFSEAIKKLRAGEIIIIYPEGTRSTTDEIGEFKRGIAHLSKLNPEIPVIPIYMHNPDKVLPKGEGLLVPFICDVFIGEAMYWNQNIEKFTNSLKENIENLKSSCITKQI